MKFIILDNYAMRNTEHGNIAGLEFVADKHIGKELYFGVVSIPYLNGAYDSKLTEVRMSILIQNLRKA